MFLGALIIQLISLIIFTCIFLRFVYHCTRRQLRRNYCVLRNYFFRWRMQLIRRDRRSDRSIVSSNFGPTAQNEALFYTLDALPPFMAISVYWPGRFILGESGVTPSDSPLAEPDNKTESTERVKRVVKVWAQLSAL